MALIKDGALLDDPYQDATGAERIPPEGPAIVTLTQWQANREQLLRREGDLGIRLRTDEPPESIADDLDRFALVALEFPVFKDGRPYSYARLLRERYRYPGEIRAVGDVLLEQLHFMLRTGFNSFELDSEDPLHDFEVAAREFSVWYQPAADGRRTVTELRHRPG
jgi:uncharacterized protein (DUF934 family)